MHRISTLFTILLLGSLIVGAQPAPTGSGGSRVGGPPPDGTQPKAGTTGSSQQGSGRVGGSLVAVAKMESRTTSIGVAGRLEPARRIVHTIGITGFVEAIHVRLGDRVHEGQLLVTLTRDAPGESYRPVLIVSRISGKVSEISVTVGSEARSGAAAISVIDDSEYRLSVALSDKDAFRVATMEQVSLTAHSADGTELSGRLSSVSAEPDYATGLFTANIHFDSQMGARTGMVLFMELPVDSVQGIFINQGLVVRRFGNSVLWIVDSDDRLRQVPISTGKPYGNDILVISGLEPGSRFISTMTGYEKDGLSLQEYRDAQKKGS